MPAERYLSRVEAAKYLTDLGIKISGNTLAKYACYGGGPNFTKFGARKVLYTEAELNVWVESRKSAPAPNTTLHKAAASQKTTKSSPEGAGRE